VSKQSLDGKTAWNVGTPCHLGFPHVAANEKYADLQWNEARDVFWLRNSTAIKADIIQKMEQRETGKLTRKGDKQRKAYPVPGVFVLRTSWEELRREGTREEMELAAVAGLKSYMGMMEV